MKQEKQSLATGSPLTPEAWADFAARLHHGCRGAGVDEHCTRDAVFLVEKRAKTYMPEDCDGEEFEIYRDGETFTAAEWYEWLDGDDQQGLDAECSPKGFLEAILHDKINALSVVCPGARVMEFNWCWGFVCQHFTQEAADAFIKRKGHDYPDGLRTYVDCSYYSWELNAIKDGIMDGRIGLIATPDETARLVAENAKLAEQNSDLDKACAALEAALQNLTFPIRLGGKYVRRDGTKVYAAEAMLSLREAGQVCMVVCGDDRSYCCVDAETGKTFGEGEQPTDIVGLWVGVDEN